MAPTYCRVFLDLRSKFISGFNVSLWKKFMQTYRPLYYLKAHLRLSNNQNNLKIKYDKTKPNGTPRKLLDSSLARKNGWKHKTSFEKGISIVINDYLKNHLRKDI